VNYSLHNRPEVDAYLSQREAQSARIKEENEKRFPQNGIRARLLARR
jgi:outer membrane protein TolC